MSKNQPAEFKRLAVVEKENQRHFVLKTELLLAVLSDFERKTGLENSVF